jgi:hypothetical protein
VQAKSRVQAKIKSTAATATSRSRSAGPRIQSTQDCSQRPKKRPAARAVSEGVRRRPVAQAKTISARKGNASTKSGHKFGAETALNECFSWPGKAQQRLKNDGSLDTTQSKTRLILHTEFAGGLTPEIAAKALASNSEGQLDVQLKTQADWSSASHEIMQANWSPHDDTCRFGDIERLASNELLQAMNSRIAIKARSGRYVVGI